MATIGPGADDNGLWIELWAALLQKSCSQGRITADAGAPHSRDAAAAARATQEPEALEELAAALPGAEVGEPDDTGVFDIRLDAADEEDALRQVWDAVAASGTDDYVVFLEHPELPEHWRPMSGRPTA